MTRLSKTSLLPLQVWAEPRSYHADLCLKDPTAFTLQYKVNGRRRNVIVDSVYLPQDPRGQIADVRKECHKLHRLAPYLYVREETCATSASALKKNFNKGKENTELSSASQPLYMFNPDEQFVLSRTYTQSSLDWEQGDPRWMLLKQPTNSAPITLDIKNAFNFVR